MTDLPNGMKTQVEEELHKTQLLLKASLESPKDMIILSIDKSYRYLFFNNNHKSIMKLAYGIDIEIGMNILDCIIADDDREKAKINYGRAFHGESHSTIEEYGDSFRSYYESFYNPIKDDLDTIIGATAFARDITHRKRAEENLREKESLMRTALENLPLVFYKIDRTGKFSLSIGAGLKGLGLEQNQVVGLSAFDVYKDFPVVTDAIRQALSGHSVSFEVNVAGVSYFNSNVPFSSKTGEFDGLIGVALDITESKKAEQALAAEKERLAVTLRSIGDGVITTDTNGTIVMINKVAEVLTGWSADDAIGKPLQEVFTIINELTRVPCENPVEKVMTTGNIIELANHTCLISKTGKEIVVADSGAPIRDGNSQIIGVVLVFRDMTEKQKLNDSMQRAQKLESIGVLAGGIAHDFNNLLGGVFGYLDLARICSAQGNTDKVNGYLTEALDVFERARSLTQQLLTFSKGGAPIRNPMMLAPLIQKCTQFALSGSNVACQCTIANDLWLCDCDENQMGQVIDNIVINAKQAMPLGGAISVIAENVSLNNNQYRSNASRIGNYVKISIQDEGTGISKEIIPKIFDPFFSTKETGHGLGLATVFSIVQRHDGWIEVESEPGKGSTFHIYIPASQTIPPEIPTHILINHQGSGKILIMDDEPFMRGVVGCMLEDMGYTIFEAKNGEEAVSLFKLAEEEGKPFALCILDLTIPGGMGGIKTVEEIKRINPQAKCIASSGYSDDPVMENPKDFGFTDKIIKPFRTNDLGDLMALHTKSNN